MGRNVHPNQQAWTINVDYTTSRDDRSILTASLVINKTSLPLYFSRHRYAKRSGKPDQKKMVRAFFTALHHLLPKKETYTIVADRGFEHLRIMELLEKNDFSYILRIKENMHVVLNRNPTNLKQLPGQAVIVETYAMAWKRAIQEVRAHYSARWAIEKMFKNQKKQWI